MLEKTFDPAQVEARIHAAWEKAEAFKCGRPERRDAPPYCIVIPPPNVTGSLHMGHALNNTLQDVLCRFERMRGKDVLWQPGTDHAGIATQMVVERQLMERQEPDRRAMGREKFLEKVWAWKAESGGTIINQLKRLGASCDWSRERFTMDPGLSQAVLKVFVELYRAGLIYKDKRLVNWDPKFQTAISDLEVEQIEKKGSFKWARTDQDKDGNPVALDHGRLGKVLDKEPGGHMYYFNYPLDGATYDPDDAETFLTVATTRPETMLGDTAVAVHPEHPRYGAWIGRTLVLPLTGRKIPIIGDDYADPEKGTGAVKITPAHDFNDFEVGKRHADKLVAPINIFDAFAQLNENVPATYRGLDRFAARKRVVADLDADRLVAKIDPHVQMVPHGDRSGVPIEPWLTDQWYVNAAELAKPAMAAVRSGKTKFVPERFAADYFRWLENIQPWCVSRQLWWGHQIPAWYGPDNQVFVALDEGEAMAAARAHYGKQVALARDPDVLDTWFSSALWPFSTLGWPEQTPEVAKFYPTSVLVTGFDIIFFWVARMMMMGSHFMEEVPFHDVYIHGLVRDEKGQKMSKSKGNVVDPLLMIEQFGADALRFSMAAMASQGSDVKFSVKRIEGYRNFATKLWNASRFAEMNECLRRDGFDPRSCEETINRWIAGETERASQGVTEAITAYRFNDAAGVVYEFVWGVFCDWYLELIKPILAGDEGDAKTETRAMVAWVLDEILKLLHPFMPFITEELWERTAEHAAPRTGLLALTAWPEHLGLADATADTEIGFVVKLVSEVRSVRSEMNVPAGAKIPLVLTGGAASDLRARVGRHEEVLTRLARLDGITFADVPPKRAAVCMVGDVTAALPLEGIIDMAAEAKRLAREIDKTRSDRDKAAAWLANEANVAKSPEHVVELNRERVTEGTERLLRLEAALKRIEG
ncbi:MAG: valine--tRNA ligase [Hyphomicrobiaceae bacterium]